MTPKDQPYSIQWFEYTEEEVRFLRLVALHGGYFVRRQFIRSANCEFGKRAQDLIDKLTARKHASREIYREDRYLYRVHYRRIYAAIGEETGAESNVVGRTRHWRKSTMGIKRRPAWEYPFRLKINDNRV